LVDPTRRLLFGAADNARRPRRQRHAFPESGGAMHPQNKKALTMRKDDVFPSKYLKAADLNGKARVLEIAEAPLETLKNASGEQQQKIVLYFVGESKRLPLNLINWDSVAEIGGEDTDDWPGARIEIFPSTTQMGGKTVPCLRVRKPRTGKAAPRVAEPPPNEDPGDGMADEVPF
jgi:hypothetical protein